MKRLTIFWVMFAALVVNLLGPVAASAAESKPLNLQTSPLPINLAVDPGKAVSVDLRIKQNSGSDERLQVSLMKFSAYGSEGKPRLIDRQPGDDYFDWVKFDKPTFMAPNNVWQTVHMTINVPKTAAFGYYYAAVFSRVGDDAKPDARNTAIQGGTAVLVLVDVRSPNAKRVLEVASFESKHGFYEFLPAEFTTKLHNVGNIHAVPYGDIFITQGKKQIATIPVNGERGNILPNSNRAFQAVWDDGFPIYKQATENGKQKVDAKGQPVMALDWDLTKLSKLRFGRYTAHLVSVYDDGKRDVALEAQVSFWVVPWRFLLALLVIMSLVGLGVYAALRGTWRGARRLGRGKRR
jgi:hypothetical protein